MGARSGPVWPSRGDGEDADDGIRRKTSSPHEHPPRRNGRPTESGRTGPSAGSAESAAPRGARRASRWPHRAPAPARRPRVHDGGAAREDCQGRQDAPRRRRRPRRPPTETAATEARPPPTRPPTPPPKTTPAKKATRTRKKAAAKVAAPAEALADLSASLAEALGDEPRRDRAARRRQARSPARGPARRGADRGRDATAAAEPASGSLVDEDALRFDRLEAAGGHRAGARTPSEDADTEVTDEATDGHRRSRWRADHRRVRAAVPGPDDAQPASPPGLGTGRRPEPAVAAVPRSTVLRDRRPRPTPATQRPATAPTTGPRRGGGELRRPAPPPPPRWQGPARPLLGWSGHRAQRRGGHRRGGTPDETGDEPDRRRGRPRATRGGGHRRGRVAARRPVADPPPPSRWRLRRATTTSPA